MDRHTQAEVAARQAALDADIRRYGEQGGPGEDELAAAPLMSDWSYVDVGEDCLCLAGFVVRHPRLGTTRVLTSAIAAMDPEGTTWCRTAGRLYRLGSRAPDWTCDTSLDGEESSSPAFN